MASYRYIVQHALTGEILSWNLPLGEVEFGPELNGPGRLSGVVEPRLPLELPGEGQALLYAERDDQLMWGGLIWQARPVGGRYPLEASGYSSYLTRRHDLHGNLGGRGPYVGADPAKVIRDVWDYCQNVPDGSLDVRVDAASTEVTVGTTEQPYATKEWEAPVLAGVVRDMTAVDRGPEWTERTRWVDGRPQRTVIVGWPRLGSRRTDLSFTSGVNIVAPVPLVLDGDAYAQVVVGLGAGDGSAKIRTVDAVRDSRLRMEYVLDAPGERSRDRLAARVRTERARRQQAAGPAEITVADHPAAPIGSWQIGDDVRVTIYDQWADFDGWRRITAWTLRPSDGGRETAVLQLSAPYTTGE
ncbi:hypothetical protein ABT095_34545 [Kitasatospora sp. NPDC002227]|uniref:hypothetical protein n=1 Tax=Kitasatospora sp. NPDC002227 TaxID=3154773 RepID=UPI00332587A4